jgi:hypothetical protein
MRLIKSLLPVELSNYETGAMDLHFDLFAMKMDITLRLELFAGGEHQHHL